MAFLNRPLYLDICNYNRKAICPIYDNRNEGTELAFDVVESIERNGWKELSFSIPSVIQTENGDERNFVLDYLKADYLIRFKNEFETDYFIISEPRITHNGYAKTVEIVAGHISQNLKYKQLGLEFSDNEGNNVGTAEELVTTILDGTDWSVGTVADFTDKEGNIKKRSLVASNSNAFKMIADVCELFDAKPVYHGETKTVDILPLNPFADYVEGTLPNIEKKDDVLEIHYGKNLKNITRTLNTNEMVTKLYAYGSYGDDTSGFCSINECYHTEYILTLSESLLSNKVYYFTVKDDADVDVSYHFTVGANQIANAEDNLVFSFLDPASMMYVWNEQTEEAYPVEKGIEGTRLNCTVTKLTEQNMFSFIMDFSYYKSIGLFTDEMLQQLAKYQRLAPVRLEDSNKAAQDLADAQTELSEAIGSINFCKLDILSQDVFSPYLKLILNKETYSDGVIYRSDYDVNVKNQFKWRACDKLDTNGDPVNAATNILYILHETNPVTWDIAYLKELDDEDEPSELTFWIATSNISIDLEHDSFYLFAYNGINGILGPLQSSDESAVTALDNATTVVTEKHPTIFTGTDISLLPITNVNGYGWAWRYYSLSGESEMYFCYKSDGDTSWKRVYFQDTEPTSVQNGQYWFDWRASVLYRRVNFAWESISSDTNTSMLVPSAYKASLTDQKIAALFPTVYMYGKTRDRYYQGMPEEMNYHLPGKLDIGNYYFETPYNSYIVFSTEVEMHTGDDITYTYIDGQLNLTIDGVKSYYLSKNYRFDNVNYHPANILDGLSFQDGSIATGDGTNVNSTTQQRSLTYSAVVPNTMYSVAAVGAATIHFYNDRKGWIGYTNVNNTNFRTSSDCYYIKLVRNKSPELSASANIHALEKDNAIVINNINYFKLNCTYSDDRVGIISYMNKFKEYADLTYGTYYQRLKEAQAVVKELENETSRLIGDMWKESALNDANYVDGDEDRLYEDALDTLKKMSKPSAEYTIGYLDLYGSNVDDDNFGVLPLSNDKNWPDVNIGTAVHLIDPEIDVNVWAFLDKIEKCYDQPWKTQITINTNLTTIAQHTFGDIMSSIADVASQVKASVSKYDSTSVTSVSYGRLDELLADLVTMVKISESAGGRITEMENEITGHRSILKQTADEISAEVSRAVSENEQMRSLIQQNANGITTIVEHTITDQINEKIGIAVSIEAPEGVYLSDEITSIPLSVKVTEGGTDITDDINVNDVDWIMVDNSTWSTAHQNMKSVTVLNTDVETKATIRVSVVKNGKQYLSNMTMINITNRKAVTVSINSNYQPVQTYNGNTDAYYPDWEDSSLVLTPVVYVNGETINLSDTALNVTWAKRVGSTTYELNPSYETVTNKKLTVSKNVMSLDIGDTVTYSCYVTYAQDNGLADVTFSLINSVVVDPYVEISGQQIFKYDKNGNVNVNAITLTADREYCNIVEWQYKNASDEFVKYPGSTASDELVVRATDAVFLTNYATIRVVTNNASVSDTYSIYKVYDGTESPIAFLTNESVAFAADENGAVAGTSVTFNIIGYIGNAVSTPVYSSCSGLPTGMTLSAGTPSGGVQPITITVANGSDLGSSGPCSGTIYINIASPLSTALQFSWSKVCSVKGDAGKSFIHGLYCPNGNVYNADTASVTITSYLYADGVNVASTVNKQWSKYVNGAWTNYTSGTAASITVNKNDFVTGGTLIRCAFTYDGISYTDIVSLLDKTDNYDAVITSSNGDKFDGAVDTVLTCNVYQQGALISVDNFTYTWSAVDANGDAVVISPNTGKNLTVHLTNLDSKITYICTCTDGSYSTIDQITLSSDNSIVVSDTAPDNPSDGALWLDTSEGHKALMRYDEEAGAWAAVTFTEEEMQNTLSVVTRYETDLSQLSDRITSTVSQIQYVNDDLTDKLSEMSTTISQTSEEISASIIQSESDSKGYTDDRIREMNSTIETWMRFSDDGLSLGKSNSTFTSKLTNDRMSFYDGNTEVSYIGNKALNITNAKVVNTLSMGNGVITNGWFDWVATPSGLGMKWKTE